jgi:polysaccharide export outer membrane protein
MSFRNLFCLATILWGSVFVAQAQSGQVSSETTAVTSGGLAVASISADYQLRPSDLLQVRVFQEEDMTRDVAVSQDFSISLPLIGIINVKGRSLRQTEELIRQLYDRDYLVNPQVTLIVLRYAERTVNVIGSVNAPQAVSFPPERGLTLLEAIARAGGFSRLANRSQVKVVRRDDKGQSTTYTVNADRLISGSSDSAWPLQVDDIIEVPERFL